MVRQRQGRIEGARRFVAPILVGLFVSAAAVVWWTWARVDPLPEGLIQANGRIEGDRYLASTRVAGRVVELSVQEGSAVSRGQVLARLEDAEIRARVEQAEAAVESAQARAIAARKTLEVLERDVPLEIEIARAELEQTEAAVAGAVASERQAARDAERLAALYAQGTVDARRNEAAALAWTLARTDLASAKSAVTRARKQLADAELGGKRIEAQGAEVAALDARLAEARAALAEVRSLLDDLRIVAPASGVVTTRIADLGEVAAAGFPLYEIVDLDRLYLEVYVAEKDIGKLRRGLPARVYVDAFPGEAHPAVLRTIAPRAEFTPKEVQTPDERVKLVYAVKLYLESNPEHRLTPGLPADAVIRWSEEAPWAEPRW